jgi:histidine ammonia-lyase
VIVPSPVRKIPEAVRLVLAVRDDRRVTVVLTGHDLTLPELLRVARGDEPVELAPAAVEAMRSARAVVESVIASGGVAYGVTTGVGMRKAFNVQAADHDRRLVRQHLTAQGPPTPHDVVRATALRVANALARGTTTVRPETAQLVIDALNEDRLPTVRLLGSIGQGDLAPLADLADGILGDRGLERGEAIALLNQNAYATAWGALALHDATTLLDALDVAGALDLEALAANPDLLHPAVAAARPSQGVRETLARLQELREGSEVEARSLQDPLTFRTLPQLHGAARDALRFVTHQVTVELNAAQSNPLVVVEEQRIVSAGGFEVQALATALDLARLALAPVISSAAERAVKLLQAPLTGLPEGLGARSGLAESALSELGIAVQAFAAEARLLAQPVSLELVSTQQAEAIEDRTTMAPLAGRRLAEMADLGARVVAVELYLAAQACELRGAGLGAGTARAHAAVRRLVPFLGVGDPLPDLEPLASHVRTGPLA